MSRIRCSGCHRVEDRSMDGVEVVAEGGQRRLEAAEQDALRTLLDAAAGVTGAAVGPCACCGQPLIAEAGGPPADAIPFTFTFAVADGMVTVGPGLVLTGPKGPVTREEAERLVAAAFPRVSFHDEPAFSGAMHAGFLVFMLAPIAVWMFSVVYVVGFLAVFAMP